jgi:8-oxo-dGTP pyrophosphatase MutT (NUDIX family)
MSSNVDTIVDEKSSVLPYLSGDVIDTTLAGDYVIQMIQQDDNTSSIYSWYLYRIETVLSSYYSSTTPTGSNNDDEREKIWTDGTRAVEALKRMMPSHHEEADFVDTQPHPYVKLVCIQNEQDHLEVQDVEWVVDDAGDAHPNSEHLTIAKSKILTVLQLLQVQWVARQQEGKLLLQHQHCTSNNHDQSIPWRVSIGSSKDVFFGSLNTPNDVAILFGNALAEEGGYTIVSDAVVTEWVEMMTGGGQVAGILPRSLVHTYNILHRGIGVLVTKDRPIDLNLAAETTLMSSSSSSGLPGVIPDLYVHRRAATKRLFPSLYDMFIGGVSSAGEAPFLTAQREVAEELGLSRALEVSSSWHSDVPILTCLVCTGYNRCLVDLFQYAMDSQTEVVRWQEEEVDWGDFCSYSTVMAAADLSIQRAAAAGTWPGEYPPIQSKFRGVLELPSDTHVDAMSTECSDSWKGWDFVPDGLLVWQAWLELLEDKASST